MGQETPLVVWQAPLPKKNQKIQKKTQDTEDAAFAELLAAAEREDATTR